MWIKTNWFTKKVIRTTENKSWKITDVGIKKINVKRKGVKN